MEIMQETLLAFGVNAEKMKKIRGLCLEMGIRPVEVPADQLQAPLGLLAGARGWMNPAMMAGQREAGSMDEEMIVMAGFSQDLLELFLDRLRHAECSVSLKAVLTDQNAVWNGGMLQEELKQERAAFWRRQMGEEK